MKINYLLNDKSEIISIYYINVIDSKTKESIYLYADNVELPSIKNYQEMEIDNIEKIHLGYSQVINGVFYENLVTYNQHLEQVRQEETRNKTINAYKQEMASIKAWLNSTDYIINKHILGEYTDTNPKWLNYLAERKVKLVRYNELEKLLK